MNDGALSTSAGWFGDLDPDDLESASEAIVENRAEGPRDWPTLAVEAGYADSKAEYYERLHEAALRATREEVRKRERADDQQ